MDEVFIAAKLMEGSSISDDGDSGSVLGRLIVTIYEEVLDCHNYNL
jgi:hypothetical protein